MKTLIAYFSHAGENYTHGTIGYLQVGNTEVVARKIHQMIPSDLFYIDTVKKYPDNHMEKIQVARKEFEENAIPKKKKKVEHMEAYSHIILAFPNWWTTMPMALFTFLESDDFDQKIICPLVTHGGSGFSNAIRDIKRLCPTATVKEGLAINGDDVNHCDDEIRNWLDQLGL